MVLPSHVVLSRCIDLPPFDVISSLRKELVRHHGPISIHGAAWRTVERCVVMPESGVKNGEEWVCFNRCVR